MFASLSLVIVLFVGLGESTVLEIPGVEGGGGFQIGIDGGSWSSGLAGNTAGRGTLGGQLTFGYSGSGLKLPLIPIPGIDPTWQPRQGANQQQEDHSQPQHSFFLGGQGSYSLQGQGGFPIKFAIPLYPVPGSPTAGTVPQAGNAGDLPPALVGNHSPTSGNPSQVPQVPQIGYPNQGGYIPQNQQPGYATQGGFIPQNPQTEYPIQRTPQSPIGSPPGSEIQPGAYPEEPPVIDPRNGARTSERPTLQGRPQTPNPEQETTENPDTIESPIAVDEEAPDENTIPGDQEEK